VNTLRAIAALSITLALPSLGAAEEPLTLDEALALATRNNPDLVLAREDATSARADHTSALSGVLPRLDFSTSFGRNFLGAQSGYTTTTGIPVPPQGPSDQSIYSLSATFSQPASSPSTPEICAWEATPRMRVRSSCWKPFMTDSTTISAATPRAMPNMEMAEMKEMKWLRRLARV